jgi:hypothetical protein
MPLVYVGAGDDKPITEQQEKARKIKPEYAGGELVRVAGGRNQADAELIQGMLLEEGIPSILRRTAGFDVPDFLAAGPRDILVPEAGADLARRLCSQAGLAVGKPGAVEATAPLRLFLWLALAVAVAAALLWLIVESTG